MDDSSFQMIGYRAPDVIEFVLMVCDMMALVNLHKMKIHNRLNASAPDGSINVISASDTTIVLLIDASLFNLYVQGDSSCITCPSNLSKTINNRTERDIENAFTD